MMKPGVNWDRRCGAAKGWAALGAAIVYGWCAAGASASGAGNEAAATPAQQEEAAAQKTQFRRSRKEAGIIVQFSEEERATLTAHPEFEIPEVYELASIIVSLTPYGSERVTDDKQRSAYAERVRKHFSAYRGHPIVAAVGAKSIEEYSDLYEMRENSYAYCFDKDEPDRLYHCKPFSHVWSRLANVFTRNISLIEDFAKVSGFRAFYAENRDFYRTLIENDRRSAPMGEMVGWLEARFDARAAAQRVVYSPLTGGWHSLQEFADDGFALMVMFIEPGPSPEEDRPYSLAAMLFTELDHGFVNPATNAFPQKGRLQRIFARPYWADAEKTIGYDSGEKVFNEYMTFAVYELWAREFFDGTVRERAAAAVRRRMEGPRGFLRYSAFSDKLIELYEAASERSEGPVQIAELYAPLVNWAEKRLAAAE